MATEHSSFPPDSDESAASPAMASAAGSSESGRCIASRITIGHEGYKLAWDEDRNELIRWPASKQLKAEPPTWACRRDEDEVGVVDPAIFDDPELPEFRRRDVAFLLSECRIFRQRLVRTRATHMPVPRAPNGRSVHAASTDDPRGVRDLAAWEEPGEPRTARCQRCGFDRDPFYAGTDPRDPELKTRVTVSKKRQGRVEFWTVLDPRKPLLSRVTPRGSRPLDPNSRRGTKGVAGFEQRYLSEELNRRFTPAYVEFDDGSLGRIDPFLPAVRGLTAFDSLEGLVSVTLGDVPNIGRLCAECGGKGYHERVDFPWNDGPRPHQGSRPTAAPSVPAGALGDAFVLIEAAKRQAEVHCDGTFVVPSVVARVALFPHLGPIPLEGGGDARPWAADAREYSGADPEPGSKWLPKRSIVCPGCQREFEVFLADAWSSAGRMICDDCLLAPGHDEYAVERDELLEQRHERERARYWKTMGMIRAKLKELGLADAAKELNLHMETLRRNGRATLHERKALQELLTLALIARGESDREIARELRSLGLKSSRTTVQRLRRRGAINPKYDDAPALMGLLAQRQEYPAWFGSELLIARAKQRLGCLVGPSVLDVLGVLSAAFGATSDEEFADALDLAAGPAERELALGVLARFAARDGEPTAA